MKKALYLAGLLVGSVLIVIGAGIRPDVPVEKLKAKYTNEHSRFVAIDGLSVHYRDEGKGLPLVLLHASPSSLQTFDGIAEELSKQFRVIRLDLPGYGLTGPNATGDYSLQWYMRFLDSFLTAVQVNSCYLAGNSFGGRLACEYAYEQPGRVKKLILLAASGYPLKEEGVLAMKMARTTVFRPIVRYVTPKFFIAMNLKEVYGGRHEVPAKTVDRYYDLLLREGNRDTFIAMSNREQGESSGHIKALRIPTLILWGKDDSIIPPRYAELFHKDIPGSRVIVYDGAGHIPQEVVPEKIAADMRAFL